MNSADESFAEYTKRLLSAIVWMDNQGNEIAREDYNYYEAEEENDQPFGALHSIQNIECGRIEFTYSENKLASAGTSYSWVRQIIDGIVSDDSVRLGYLNQMPYFVAYNNNASSIRVFNWAGGQWQWFQTLNLPVLGDSMDIITGDGWFGIKSFFQNDTNGFTPVTWNGSSWVLGDVIYYDDDDVFFSSSDYVGTVHKNDGSDTCQVNVFWSKWGRTYSKKISCLFVNVSSLRATANQNHILFSWNTSHMHVCEIVTLNGLALLNGSFGGGSFPGQTFLLGNHVVLLQKTNSNSYVTIWGWDGEDWRRTLTNYELDDDGKNFASIQMFDDDYLVIKHDSGDHLTVLKWDGVSWKTVEQHKDLVGFKEDGTEWNGYAGDDFLVVTHPGVKKEKKKEKLLGITLDTYYRTYVYQDDLVSLYSFSPKSISSRLLGNLDQTPLEKKIQVGNQWFMVYGDVPFVRQGAWIHGATPDDWTEENTENHDLVHTQSFSGSPFLFQRTGFELVSYHPVNGSFRGDHPFYMVQSKKVLNPTLDEIHDYRYFFILRNDIGNGGFDFVNNTPLVRTMKTILPEGAGMVSQTFMPIGADRFGMGLITGQSNSITHQYTSYQYHRFSDTSGTLGWPDGMYLDKVVQVVTDNHGLTTEVAYQYALDVNGQVSSVKTSSGNRTQENQIHFAAEKYPEMKDQNRLMDVALSFSCNPACSESGSVITSASANRYDSIDGSYRLVDQWAWIADAMSQPSALDFQWTSPNQSINWRKTSAITSYHYGVPEAVKNGKELSSVSVFEYGMNGLKIADVQNALKDEVFVLTGENCGIPGIVDSTCSLVDLSGNATQGQGVDYGRFSSKAVLLTSARSLQFEVTASQSGKYRFSAWVQNAEATARELKIYINGQEQMSWSLSANSYGQWQEIEFVGFVAAGGAVIDLQLPSGGIIRVQDIRFVPADAGVSSYYWDRDWLKPLVTVNHRGVGSYSQFDVQGRILNTFVEHLNGDVVLGNAYSYFDASCQEFPEGADALGSLNLSGVPVLLNGAYQQRIPVFEESNDFTVSWTTLQSRDKVRYRMYPTSTSGETAEWKFGCCSERNWVELSFNDSPSWNLELDVEPYEQNIYTFVFERSDVGWVRRDLLDDFYGSQPKFAGNQQVDAFFYLTDDDNRHSLTKAWLTNTSGWDRAELPDYSKTPPQKNLIQNGDFSEGESMWILSARSPASATFNVIDGKASIDVLTGGRVSFRNADGISLKNRRRYQISFEGYSSSPARIRSFIPLSAGNVTITDTITQSRQKYSAEFTVDSSMYGVKTTVYLVFPESGTYHFDNIKLVEIDPPTDLIRNGDFSLDDQDAWYLYGDTTSTSIRINNDFLELSDQTGTGGQLQYKYLSLQGGRNYRLLVDARGSRSGCILVDLWGNQQQDSYASLELLMPAGEWEHGFVDFTMPDSIIDGILEINFDSFGAGLIEFDNISLILLDSIIDNGLDVDMYDVASPSYLSGPALVNVPSNVNQTLAGVYAGGMVSSEGNEWQGLPGLSEERVLKDMKVALDTHGVPWVAFSGPGEGLQTRRLSVEDTSWINVGSNAVFDSLNPDTLPIDFQRGIASDFCPKDMDMMIDSEGHPVIAFIDELKGFQTENESAPPLVVVKRLYSEEETPMFREVWAGLSSIDLNGVTTPNYVGDLLNAMEGNPEEALVGAQRVQIAEDSGKYHLAVTVRDEESGSSKEILKVFWGHIETNWSDGTYTWPERLMFDPVWSGVRVGLDSFVTTDSIAALDPDDPYQFMIHDGTLYLAFVSETHRLTVIKRVYNEWVAVGKPEFVSVDEGLRTIDFEIDSLGQPYALVQKKDNVYAGSQIVPYAYHPGNSLLTLETIEFSGVHLGLDFPFRSYLLNYSGSWSIEEDSVLSTIRFVPSNPNDVEGFQLIRNGTLYNSWAYHCSDSTQHYRNCANNEGDVDPVLIGHFEGKTDLQLIVVGKNGDQLVYRFNLDVSQFTEPKFYVSGGLWRSIGSSEEFDYEFVSYGNNPELDLVFDFEPGWILTIYSQGNPDTLLMNGIYHWNAEAFPVLQCELRDPLTQQTRSILITSAFFQNSGLTPLQNDAHSPPEWFASTEWILPKLDPFPFSSKSGLIHRLWPLPKDFTERPVSGTENLRNTGMIGWLNDWDRQEG